MVKIKLPPLVNLLLYLLGFGAFLTIFIFLVMMENPFITFYILTGLGTLSFFGLSILTLGDIGKKSSKKTGKDAGIDVSYQDMNRLIFQFLKDKDGLVKEYLNILKTGNTITRNRILSILEKFDNPEIIPAILDTLENDKDVFAKRKAADILGKIGNKQILDQMKIILRKEHDRFVKKNIQNNIEKLERS
jgi:hypothetical protein